MTGAIVNKFLEVFGLPENDDEEEYMDEEYIDEEEIDEPSIRIVVSDVTLLTIESTFSELIITSLNSLLFAVNNPAKSFINIFPLFVQFLNLANMYCKFRCSKVFLNTKRNKESCGGLNCINFGK